MKFFSTYFFTFLAICLSLTINVEARPEYAAAHGFVSCTLCHASPFGGGIRNETGKIYGSHGLGNGVWTKNSFFQVDSRIMGVQTQTANATSKGLFQMSTVAQVHLPVVVDEKGKEELSFVAGQNFGPVMPAMQDAYGLFTYEESHLLAGRFQIPFGLNNDEHRTFVRIMSGSTQFNYEEGAAYTFDYKHNLHVDFAVTSGVANEVTQPVTNNDSPYGVIVNVRHNPFKLPMFFGASYRRDGTQTLAYPLEATSLYFVTATEWFTNALWKGSITMEAVDARGWNNSKLNTGVYGIGYFIPSSDTAWSSSLTASRALGLDLQLNWNWSPRLMFTLKQEQFTPDTTYTADTFQRYGLGFKYFINSNYDITTRAEHSYSTRPGVTESSGVMAVGTTVFVLLHIWI